MGLAVDSLDVELELLEGEVTGLFMIPQLPPNPPPVPSPQNDSAAKPKTVPPPLSVSRARSRQEVKDYVGRTRFDDLFAPDGASMPKSFTSIDAKVDFFRERVKRAEAQIARFRDAWTVREREMDALERTLQRETSRADQSHARADSTAQTLERLQAFVDAKKREVEDYGQQTVKAFSDLKEQEIAVRGQLDALRRTTAEQRQQYEDTIERLRRELDAATRTTEKLKALSDTQRRALAERQRQIEGLVEEVQTVARGEHGGGCDVERDDVIRSMEVALEAARNARHTLEIAVDEKQLEAADAVDQRRNVEGQLEEARLQLRQTLAALEQARGRESDVTEQLEAANKQIDLVGKQKEVQARVDAVERERLLRTLGLARTLLNELEQQSEAVIEELHAATGSAREWPEHLGEIHERLRKTLAIAERLIGTR